MSIRCLIHFLIQTSGAWVPPPLSGEPDLSTIVITPLSRAPSSFSSLNAEEDPSSNVKYGYGPVEMKCPVCDQQIKTHVTATYGKGAYACCFGMMVVWYVMTFAVKL